jgi:hypothetical protein
MRLARNITADEENFRVENKATLPNGDTVGVVKRKAVEPEPIGTIVLLAFKITGYDPDCDGSLMARLENIGLDGHVTGLELNCMGIYPTTDLVVTETELRTLYSNLKYGPCSMYLTNEVKEP